MRLILNGELRDLDSVGTVLDLLASLELGENRVLVELNGDPVQRALFPSKRLAEGDRVEIVRIAAGG